jgi:hypothetical protein
MPNTQPAQPACPFLETTPKTFQEQMKALSTRINKKWMLLIIFGMIFFFMVYIVFINVSDILKIYRNYRDNVQRKQPISETTTVSTAAFDNETYNYEPLDNGELQDEGKTIRKNIQLQLKNEDIKLYNKRLLERNPKYEEDVIDEKVLSPEYDNYSSK